MTQINKILALIAFLISIQNASAQKVSQDLDSVRVSSSTPKFRVTSLIIPSVFISYGFISLENEKLKSFNLEIKEEFVERANRKILIDDVTLHLPYASVYALNLFGIKGKHNFKDRSIILGTAILINYPLIIIIKNKTNVWRPDQSNNHSFPSGHTAIAFMGAEFLHQEYKSLSIWYSVAGYAIATGTGFLRMYNNKHWFSDVVTGAGIGILSTKVSYWIYPWLKDKILSRNKNNWSAFAIPTYDGKQLGVGLSMVF